MDQLANSQRLWDPAHVNHPAGRDSAPVATAGGPSLERSMVQEVSGWSQAQTAQRLVQPLPSQQQLLQPKQQQQQVSMVPWTFVQDPRARPPGFYNGPLNGNYGFYGANGTIFAAYERRPVSGLPQSAVALPVGASQPQGDFLNGIVRSSSLNSRCWQTMQQLHTEPSPQLQHPQHLSVAKTASDASLVPDKTPQPGPLENSTRIMYHKIDGKRQELDRKPIIMTSPCAGGPETSNLVENSQPCSKNSADRKQSAVDCAGSILNKTSSVSGERVKFCEAVPAEYIGPESTKVNTKLLPTSSLEKLGLKPGRRVSIRAKEWAGEVVWAKLARDPWWPAQVLGDNDPFIPLDADRPRLGAVPVRFFGTYDFAWIESQRSLSPFEYSYQERCCAVDLREFVQGINEALELQHTGKLPQGFADAMEEAKPSSISKSKLKPSKVGVKRHEPATTEKQVPAETRKAKVMRLLGLSPPAGSPYIKNWAINPNLIMLTQNALR